jgi:glutamate-1-semialdehyde 2,1-aminomutase/spore coat polysaccharide biosynthesis protein SpsF
MNVSPHTVVILQARMGSSRLPGKVLMDLGGKTVLEHCLERAARIPSADIVCLATSELERDDPIIEALQRMPDVVPYRGSEHDVLSRYYGAASATGADIVMRLTCDCPLIDPAICEAVLQLQRTTGAPYASNTSPRGWPHGLDCEVFTFDALKDAASRAVDAYDREHVTPWIKRLAGERSAHLKGPGGFATEQRWTLDYPEDIEFLRALYDAAGPGALGDWRTILDVVSDRPDIAAINRVHAG